MYNLIASSFFQKKYCQLPGIGSIALISHPATTDFVNSRIKAPMQEVVFEPQGDGKNIFNEFSAISELLLRKITEGGQVDIEGVGIFYKDAADTVKFAPVKLDETFTPAVAAERVIRQDARHTILVGDKETTNTAMTEYFSEERVEKKERWWIWAILLAAVGLALLFFYVYQHGMNGLANIADV
jgi:hypothetical protein